MSGILNALIGSFAPAGGSFESIATVTPSSGATSVTFSSIPSTYQHLQIRGIYRDTNTAGNAYQNLFLQFNSDTGNNYASHAIIGTGSTASATGGASATYITLNNSGSNSSTLSNTFGVFIVDVHDYASTNKNKTTRSFHGCDFNVTNTDSRLALGSGLWMNTNAINTIRFSPAATAFATGTTFALYGIKGA